MKRPLYNAVYGLLHDRGHFLSAICVRFSFLFTDEFYLKMQYRLIFGKPLDLNNPITFNEKVQWLKLYYHRPDYTILADKVKVKQCVRERIGEQYVVPLLGVWDRPEEIEWGKLPEKFVLKTNHDGGNFGVVICRDKETFDKAKAIRKLKASLRRNTYLLGREWAYKDIPRKVFAEQYIEDESTNDLFDYKFFCFDGKVKLLMIATDRQSKTGAKFDLFDENFNYLDLQQGPYLHASITPQKPVNFELMKELAETLSKDMPQVRVDFFEANNKVFFSEYTLYPSGGWAAFYPDEYDHILGQYFHLPEKVK